MPNNRISLKMRVNGEERTADVHPMDRLLDVLRVDLGLTGTKEGCGEGECGACAVMLDGQLVCSCLVPAAQASGREVRTIEGVAESPVGRALQDAFVRVGGAQCGICTPGMILAAADLIDRTPTPSLDEVRTALAGNLCRCTGYKRIYDSVLDAAHTVGEAKR